MSVNNLVSSALLVFGASGTLGRAMVREALRSGRFDKVVGCGFQHPAQADLNFQFDIRSAGDLQAFSDQLCKKNVQVRAIVNCIGETHDGLTPDTSLSDWDAVMELNLRSAFMISRTFLPVFVSQRSGHFVFIGSHSGLTGRTGQSQYSAAKAALIGMAQSLAREYGRRHIQANIVLPGILRDSPLVHKMPAKTLSRLESENTLGSTSTVDEVAGFILHLLSMKHVSGQVFALDSRILPQG